jgi:hypothetical protein
MIPTPLRPRPLFSKETEGMRRLEKTVRLGRMLAESGGSDHRAPVLPPQQLPRASRAISQTLPQGIHGSDVL